MTTSTCFKSLHNHRSRESLSVDLPGWPRSGFIRARRHFCPETAVWQSVFAVGEDRALFIFLWSVETADSDCLAGGSPERGEQISNLRREIFSILSCDLRRCFLGGKLFLPSLTSWSLLQCVYYHWFIVMQFYVDYCTVYCLIIIFYVSFAVYVLITRFMFLYYSFYVCFLVLYFAFVFCVFCVFVLFCVLFLVMYTVVSFLFVYKFIDHCHRVETQV
jgi:hypothetical protein